MSWGRLSRAGTLRFVVSALAGAVLLLSGASAADAASFRYNPIVFVHGIEGSGGQFESQKMRFISNGYPSTWFEEVDYNSTRAVGDKSEVDQQIDAAVAKLQQRTGKRRVDVIAHSLGTSVMYDYLTNGDLAGERSANVAHYINVDGQNQNPGVETLAVWAGRGTPGRSMADAENVTIPNQTHVQTCTSKESFVEYYKFLTNRRPRYDIRREKGAIQVAGKALNFPENSGAVGTTVQIWPVNDQGQRTGSSPVASIPITDNSTGGGAWGPVTVQSGKRYEFALVDATAVRTLHIYYEPFVRSDYTLRLLRSQAIENYVGNRPGSAAGVFIRYKELWGDQGAESDELRIDGRNVCTPTLCPISKQVNAFFAFDVNRDGQSDLSAPEPTLSSLPFITGADVYMRASAPPDATISFQLLSRGAGPIRTLNIPNWDSVTDGFTIQWNDFE
jgi:triacylglycerol esterase/lipase EstA (alpha/beta hydrolase family)